MLDRIKGKIVFECDGCSDALETETGNFEEANQQRSSEGWIAKQESGVWYHYCGDCKGEN